MSVRFALGCVLKRHLGEASEDLAVVQVVHVGARLDDQRDALEALALDGAVERARVLVAPRLAQFGVHVRARRQQGLDDLGLGARSGTRRS